VAALASPPLFAAADADATGLLAKARAAYQRNQAQEKHWNWTVIETRTLIDKAGRTMQGFPAVTAESVIRNDGRRCNAVVAWSDGRTPYLAGGDADARCQAMEVFRPPFAVASLLDSGDASVLERSATAVTMAIAPDRARLKSKDPVVRCAASIRATLKLDPSTFFPISLNGQVVDSGCDVQFAPVVQYDSGSRAPVKSSFRKGSTFQMDFALQHDKFGHPENSFWICAAQRYVQPWNTDDSSLYYWGRRVPVRAGQAAHRLIKEIRTTAKEFGGESQLRFDKFDTDKQ
jgi:hypothetical protein